MSVIVGAGTLAFPFVMKQCGVVFALFFLALLGYLNVCTLQFLCQCGRRMRSNGAFYVIGLLMCLFMLKFLIMFARIYSLGAYQVYPSPYPPHPTLTDTHTHAYVAWVLLTQCFCTFMRHLSSFERLHLSQKLYFYSILWRS